MPEVKMGERPQPFKLTVPAADIVDLRARLARTRLPDQAPGPAWAYGTDVTWMRELVEYWRDGFDWRVEEAHFHLHSGASGSRPWRSALPICFADLMTNVLGYERFGAQGGDWGSFITSRLAYAHGERLIGIHLNLMPLRRDRGMVADPTPDERKYLEELAAWLKEETGYQWIQGTRPQTLAFALSDSPAGLAAWIVEKFRAWSDCGGI